MDTMGPCDCSCRHRGVGIRAGLRPSDSFRIDVHARWCCASHVVTELDAARVSAEVVSGFFYLRARYYDPTTGQFIPRDPVGTLTRTPYTYVADSPLNGSDPGDLFFGAFALPGGGVLIGGTAGAGLCVFGGCEALTVVATAAGAVFLGYEIGTAGNQLLDAADPGLTAGAAWIGSNVLNAKKSNRAMRAIDGPTLLGGRACPR